MQKIGTIIIFLFVLVSCSKTIDPIDIEDEILYKNLDPAIKASTVDHFSSVIIETCSVNQPFPEDSTVTLWLDINDDNVDDFIIDISHNKSVNAQDCDECSFYEYQITISGATDNNYISFEPNYSWVPIVYNVNDTVVPASSWNKEVFLLMQGGCDRWIIDLEDTYIGVKHNNDIGWIHIGPSGNYGIEIKEHALNLTDNRPIAAGQKQ